MRRSAIISPCGAYRYSLTRGDGPALAFIMLNPSIADASIDDPTIRRCVAFAAREGYAAITVRNLFALRATDPAHLSKVPDPIGPDNDHWLLDAFTSDQPCVAAWGAEPFARQRAMQARRFAAMMGARLYALGVTKDGSPRHPLYLRADASLIPYEGAL